MNARTLFCALVGFASAPALAQSEFDLDDFDTSPSSTVADEKAALLDEDPAGAANELLRRDGKKRVIKTLQQKDVLKINRTELGLGVGLVTNDPFVNRYIIRLDGTYHFTEITAVQIEGGFSPNLGEADWKGVTRQIIEENRVTPDISKLQFYANATLQFAPIYGKVAAPGNRIINFDIYGLFGTGFAQTADDLNALGLEGDPRAATTASQIQPTLNYGGGVRVLLNRNLGFRVEGRGISYIETIDAVNLEMKNNVVLQGSFTYFLGQGN